MDESQKEAAGSRSLIRAPLTLNSVGSGPRDRARPEPAARVSAADEPSSPRLGKTGLSAQRVSEEFVSKRSFGSAFMAREPPSWFVVSREETEISITFFMSHLLSFYFSEILHVKEL